MGVQALLICVSSLIASESTLMCVKPYLFHVSWNQILAQCIAAYF